MYTPSHITITRVDGQMKRTVAVTEVMDQLLRYTQQNSQLLIVQEQLGVRCSWMLLRSTTTCNRFSDMLRRMCPCGWFRDDPSSMRTVACRTSCNDATVCVSVLTQLAVWSIACNELPPDG